LEVARRTADKAFAENASLREASARWYEPATLDLLNGTPINCLLVTFSAGAEAAVEGPQQQLVKDYARRARERGIAVLGIVYPGADPAAVAAAAEGARLDGLVLDGKFSADFAGTLEAGLRAKSSGALVIPIARDAAFRWTAKAPLLAIQGVQPGARNLSDTGIRAGASAEPWIESNIWLVRSFRVGEAWRPVWVSQQPSKPGSQGDYLRYVADAAVAGGRWIVALDDDLRAQLFRQDNRGLATWHGIAAYLKFAEDHADWRSFVPYGNLGVILDTAGQNSDFSDEYLNLATRRHVPYRLVSRRELTSASLANFQAVLAPDLAPATAAERKILSDFAEKGGLVVTGPSWGEAPKDEPYAEVRLGKGRVAVYKEDPPDPESVAKDLADLMDPEAMGFSVFNVPSGITDVSTSGSGRRVLVQVLSYADYPSGRVTIRVNGNFKSARLYTPEDAPAALTVEPAANNRTEVLIAKPARWAALLLE